MGNNWKSLPFYAPSADDDGNFDSDSSGESSPKSSGNNSEMKTDWEKAYKGLQKKYDVLKQKYDKSEETVAQLEVQKADLEIQLEGKSKEVNNTKTNVDKFQQDLQTLQDQLKAKDVELARNLIVMKEFPDMGSLIDTLPKISDPEQFRESLKQLQTTIDARVEAEIQKKLKGTQVNDSEGPGKFSDTPEAETIDTLYEKLLRFPAVRTQKQELEYQSINRKYLDLVAKQ